MHREENFGDMWPGTLKEPESVRFLSEARSLQSTPKGFTDPAGKYGTRSTLVREGRGRCGILRTDAQPWTGRMKNRFSRGSAP